LRQEDIEYRSGIFRISVGRRPSILAAPVPKILRIPLAIDPIQKFDEPLTIDPKQDFLILWIILRKFLIAASETAFDVYPNLAVD
jgi:hypothetical protein